MTTTTTTFLLLLFEIDDNVNILRLVRFEHASGQEVASSTSGTHTIAALPASAVQLGFTLDAPANPGV